MNFSSNRKLLKTILVFTNLFVLVDGRSYFPYRRVAYGTEPPSYTYPYSSQVFLEIKQIHDAPGVRGVCSGTIITELLILSAAHCFDNNVTKVDIGYGSFDRSSAIKIPAESWTIHPSYFINHLDIGVAVSSKSFRFDQNFQPVLPDYWLTSSESLINSSPSSVCGWGSDEKSRLSDLKCINFRNINQKCLRKNVNHHEFDWCFYAGEGPDGPGTYQSTCSGDSGAGIFIRSDDGQQKIIAVSVRGPKCGHRGSTIGVHLVEIVVNWLYEQIENVHGNICSVFL